MESYVLNIREDICSSNNKDVAATELLKVMGHYGTVEKLEDVLAKNNAQFQSNINGLTAQLNAIKELELASDEISMVRAYRTAKNSIVAKYTAENESLKESLRKADEKAKDMSRKICETLEAYATE